MKEFVIDKNHENQRLDKYVKKLLSRASTTLIYKMIRKKDIKVNGLKVKENYILKSPMRRIHKIKTDKTIKETYSDEALEILRDNTTNLRDLAIVDILASTGMRVGELVKLNIVCILRKIKLVRNYIL